MISKTREGAKVPSRKTVYSEFDNSSSPIDFVGGRARLGGPSVDALQVGITYPNAQDAINELRATARIPLNCVMVSTDSTPPTAISQAETITFGGTVAGKTTNPAITKAIVHVLGMPFLFDIGTNADVVCNAVVTAFQDLRDAGKIFKTIQRKAGTTTPIIELEYNDNVAHEISSYTESGISIARAITQPARDGYGQWSLIGQETKAAFNPPNTILYYYKRVA